MASLIERYGSPEELREARPERPTEAYGALIRAIVGQQLSTKAARTIFGRLTDLFGDRTPTPEELIETDPEQLRAVGLSRAKAAYLRDLAVHIETGELDLDHLPELDDERVIDELDRGQGARTLDRPRCS